MRPVRQVLLLARHASENASGAAGGCPQSVKSAVLRAFEDSSRTPGGCFWHRISLLYRRSLFCAPSASENAFRAEKGGFHTPNISSVPEKPVFAHRMLPKMRRVPQEAFLSTECQFRTVEGGFWYGALPKTHRTWLSGAQESGWQLPLRGLSTSERGPFPVPSAVEGAGEGSAGVAD